MSGYHAIVGNVWDRAFRHLSLEAKLTAFYIATSPLSRSEGLFVLPTGHVAVDTGLTVEQVEGALDELTVAGLVDYDPETELVLDRRAAKACQLRMGTNRQTGEPEPDKRIKSAVAHFERLPSSLLKETFRQLVAENSPALAEALPPPPEAPWKPLASPSEGASKSKSKSASTRSEGQEQRCEVCGDDPCCCSPAIRMQAQVERQRQTYERQTGERLGAA